MFTAYIVVTFFTAVANTYGAIVDFRRPQWVLDNIAKWGGSHSWLFPLGVPKAAGALGLLVGIGVPLMCRMVLAPSLAVDVSAAGCGIAGVATGGLVKDAWQLPSF